MLLRSLTKIAQGAHGLTFAQVRGHAGDPFNEFAQVLAKDFSTGARIATPGLGTLPLDFLYCEQLRQWAWLETASPLDRLAWPPTQDDALVVTSHVAPEDKPKILGLREVKLQSHISLPQSTISLKVCTANVLTCLDKDVDRRIPLT